MSPRIPGIIAQSNSGWPTDVHGGYGASDSSHTWPSWQAGGIETPEYEPCKLSTISVTGRLPPPNLTSSPASKRLPLLNAIAGRSGSDSSSTVPWTNITAMVCSPLRTRTHRDDRSISSVPVNRAAIVSGGPCAVRSQSFPAGVEVPGGLAVVQLARKKTITTNARHLCMDEQYSPIAVG